MITSIDDVARELASGTLLEHRHENLELKQSWRDDNGPKLSALGNNLNIDEGWFVVGVKDDGTLVGHDEGWARGTEQVISQHLNRHLDPTQTCTGVRALQVPQGWVIAVSVRNPGAVVNWEGKAYKRAGTTIEEMRPEEILELTIALPGLADYSRQPWIGPVNDDSVAAYANAVAARQDDPAVAARRGLASEQLLGRLSLLGRNASRILFGDCRYRVILYDEHGDPQQNATQRGLYDLVSGRFIERVQIWARQQFGTNETPFPPLALKEALANAVAHAAYFESDGDITIEVLSDKVIISNLCLPESAYFANRWFSRSRKTVNGLLMEALRLAGAVDELGRGKNLIFRDSINSGVRPPQVAIEKAGRYDRWRLYLYGGTRNEMQLRLLRRIQDLYPDPQKALIAFALVLWRNMPLSEIRQYIDGESAALFAEVITDLNGPVFYIPDQDRLVLSRWVRVLVEEGKDSKTLTPAEEQRLYDLAYDLTTQYDQGLFTPKRLRELAELGETASDRTTSSNLLKKWLAEGKIKKARKGVYEFVARRVTHVDVKRLLERLQSQSK